MVNNNAVDPNQFTILKDRLSNLLGFADGVEDVLENLLTSIDSRANLLDYLIQLLGTDRQDQLRDFVDDVEIVKQGGTLSVSVVQQNDETKSLSAPNVVQNTTKSAQQQQQQKQQSSSIHKKDATDTSSKAPKTNPQQKTSVVASKQQHKQQQSKVQANKKQNNNSSKKNGVKATANQQQHEDKELVGVRDHIDNMNINSSMNDKPLQGTAKYVCGCFGVVHKSLTNCLHCGRISCHKEVENEYCPFCHYLYGTTRTEAVSSLSSSSMDISGTDVAWEQKERLLQYDREFAQRTIILDDQEDYYNQATSSWLTKDERTIASQQEQKRSNDIQTRQKMKLQLSDDI